MIDLKIRNFRWLIFAAVATATTSISSMVQAAEVPGISKQVVLNAREQPIDLFVSELFGQIGVPARVDESIIGSVNGDFRKSAGEVIDEISSAFQLSVYYDGAVAHIYPANDIQRKVLYMSGGSASSVVKAAAQLGLTDRRNTVKATEVGLVATGADKFIGQIDRLAAAVGNKPTSKAIPAPVPKADYDTYRIFKLKYAWADDVSLVIGGDTVVVPGVASLIRSLIEPGALGAVPVTTRTPGSTSLDGLRGQGLSGRGLQEVSNPSDVDSKASRPLVGSPSGGGSTEGTRIVADPLSNSVIIRDRADRMDSYDSLIQELDKEPQMVEIEATIIDLDTDKLRELGINWRLTEGNSDVLLGNGTVSDELLRPDTVITPSGAGGIVSLVLGSRQQFISRIRALETQGAARIVSKPHVMTLSNVEALLDTTSTFFVRVAGQEEVDLFDVKVGTRLRVTPHVYERGNRRQIKLRVNITDGSTSEQSVDSIPIIEESNINTQAIVDVGQSLLIGGLVREIKSNGISRVPVLGRLPVVGGLFRTQVKNSTRQERMFLITPRITTPHIPGKRFNAPVLAGTENDIIQSSSTRLQGANQALNLLDEANPVEQYLPKGDGLMTKNLPSTQPFQPMVKTPPPQPITSGDLQVNQGGSGSLRDRLTSSNEASSVITARPQLAAQSLPEFVELPAASVTGSRASGDYGWQTLVTVPSASTIQTRQRQASVAQESVPAKDEDELIWQVVE